MADPEAVLKPLRQHGKANASRLARALGTRTRPVEVALSSLYRERKVTASGRGRHRDYEVA